MSKQLGNYLIQLSENILAHWCPACKDLHQVNVGTNGWRFNENLETPDFKPSIRVRTFEGQEVASVCHYFVDDGVISYCNDSTHEMAGQKVPLPIITAEIFSRA